jgi:hypothetical protein
MWIGMARTSWTRWLLIVLGLGACAALTLVVAGGTAAGGERFTAPHTRAGAAHEVEIVLGTLVLPPGAARLGREPHGDNGILGLSGEHEASVDSLDRHAWWRVPGGWQAVLAFVHAHPPQGSHEFTSGSGEAYGRQTSASITFGWPTSPGELRTRQLSVQVITRPGNTTLLRADARAAWISPRSATERVPNGVREIDIQRSRPRSAPTLSLRVTNPSEVHALIAAVDRLPILQPGPISCTMIGVNEPQISFGFRDAPGGRVLALASERAGSREPTSGCDPMSFSIRGVAQTPLLEGPRVVAEAERLLRAKL